MGNLLLGAFLEEFSSFGSTFNALFYMQLGGIEYATLAEAHDGEEEVVLAMVGLLFYYSYMMLVFFVLVNGAQRQDAPPPCRAPPALSRPLAPMSLAPMSLAPCHALAPSRAPDDAHLPRDRPRQSCSAS